MIDIDEWLKSGKYLPRFMRDFHDQKDVFKAIHEIISANPSTKEISWVEAHCYVIDVFLWFMATRGWTLQRTRVKGEFLDIDETIEKQNAARRAAYLAVLPMSGADKKPVVASQPHVSKGEEGNG